MDREYVVKRTWHQASTRKLQWEYKKEFLCIPRNISSKRLFLTPMHGTSFKPHNYTLVTPTHVALQSEKHAVDKACVVQLL